MRLLHKNIHVFSFNRSVSENVLAISTLMEATKQGEVL